MDYRNSTEIIDDMLRVGLPGESVTKMMYKAYLSHDQLKKYLELLQGNHLIKYDEKSRLYTTTDKGKKYLEDYDEIRKLLSLKKEKEYKVNLKNLR